MMGRKIFLVMGLLVCLVLAGSTARADIIYTNFGTGDYAGSPFGQVEMWYTPPLDYDGVALGFTSPGDYTLESLEVVIASLTPFTNYMEFELLSDAGGMPGTSLGSVQVLDAFPPDVPGVTTITLPTTIALNAGQNYWLVAYPDISSLNPQPPLPFVDEYWYYGSSYGPYLFMANSNNPVWADPPIQTPQPAFRLLGTPSGGGGGETPEPGTMLLLGSAAGLTGLWKKRRKRVA